MTIEIIQPVSPEFSISLAGPQGPAGPAGIQGVPGAAGSNGTNGANGAQWLNGTSNPTSGQGVVGDWFINTVSQDIYKKTNSTTWTLQANIKGATGLTGAAGTNGTNGTNGINAAGFNANAASFIAETPFFIAHRGSGEVYPEHTMEAYASSIAAGAKAIEISVSRTADGVLVCHHDLDTLRMTGKTGTIASKPYSSLRQGNLVDGRPFLGPNWDLLRIPTLREVLDRFGGKVVMFIEPKDSSAACVNETIAMIVEFGLQSSVIWKEYQALNYVKAHAANLKVWGYLQDAASEASIDLVAGKSDYLGVNVGNTDAFFTSVISRGKPVISWPLTRRSEVTRLQALGVVGMMCSGWSYLTKSAPIHSVDNFNLGVKVPGEISWSPSDASQQPGWNLTNGSRAFAGGAGQSLCLGDFCPITATTYSISFDMMYETIPSDTTAHHAGIVFGKVDDQKYQFNTANPTPGYHFVFRPNGSMQLYTHSAGVTSGTSLNSVTNAVAVAGEWASFKIDVTPTQITVTRTDASVGGTKTFTVTNNAHRGGYIHLSKHAATAANTVHYRNVTVV